jgi:hypothetical protein
LDFDFCIAPNEETLLCKRSGRAVPKRRLHIPFALAEILPLWLEKQAGIVYTIVEQM